MTDRDILKTSLAPTPQCLTPVQLEKLLDGKQADPHLAGCPRCQAELALLKQFESAEPLAEEGAAVSWISAQLARQRSQTQRSASGRVSSWGRLFAIKPWRWAIPVTAAAAILVAALVLRAPKEPQLQANAGGQRPIYRSQEVQVVAPVGELTATPQTLQWEAFPGTGIYQVKLMEVDHTVLWSTRTKEIGVAIPANIRAKMLPSKPILWQVTALDENDRVLASSQVQRFSSSHENSSQK